MRVLLDTCSFIWLDQQMEHQFGTAAHSLLCAGEGTLVLSVASIWEIAIKSSIGKLTLATNLSDAISRKTATGRMEILEIYDRHAMMVAELPFHHRDPFDRLIVAQSILENLPIVSADRTLDLYGIKRIWAVPAT